jgi:hypothetical protein
MDGEPPEAAREMRLARFPVRRVPVCDRVGVGQQRLVVSGEEMPAVPRHAFVLAQGKQRVEAWEIDHLGSRARSGMAARARTGYN